jgi:hypothetical protein
MESRSPVEIADQVSRRRATGMAVATIVFLAIQFITRPVFVTGPNSAPSARIEMWAINAIVLLLLLATGGGLLYRRKIKELVNDEISRLNYKTAVAAGYWVAMITAMSVYLLPALGVHTAREAVYLIVTLSIGVALLTFAFLERRALSDE